MADPALSGVLLMHKPAGFTSFDVVAKLRGILHTRKLGHGGTLDPMATGVLPVFVGGATRAVDYAAAQDKEYVAGFTLGLATDTQDTTGTVLETSSRIVTSDEVAHALSAFRGDGKQVPPMYSAVKIDGKRLYNLARQGKEIERPARDITVHTLELLDFSEHAQQGTLRAVVSKGTYIRTLIHDLGHALGSCAAMHSLVRTRAGAYALSESVDFAAVEHAMAEGTITSLLRPTDSLFLAYPRVDLDAYGYARACSGAFIAPEHAPDLPLTEGALSRVYYEDTFLMLGRTGTLDRGGPALFVHKNFR